MKETVSEYILRLKRDNRRLLAACQQALRRINKLNEGGPEEPDPTVEMLAKVLAKHSKV